jgi:regulator of protease activity HflC (stomatin/prohibitin superfamily)
LVGIALFLTVAVLGTCLTKVRLNEVGVKVDNLGGGIVTEDYLPGYHIVIPGMHTMYRFDPTVQTLNMGGSDSTHPAAEIRSKDQYMTRFDITVLYRIHEKQANLVAKEIGLDQKMIVNFVRSNVDKVLWGTLGSLNTQDYYNVKKREEARKKAKASLAEQLKPRHLEMVDILIRAIAYQSNLEEILVQKQLLDQRKALNVEKTRLEKELEKTQSIERETEAKVRVIAEEKTQEIANIVADTDAKVRKFKADADFESEKLLAEADRYRRTKMSEGELAKTQAKAKGDKAINEAYSASGGQAYITRQMVENLTYGNIEVNTNAVNPFDVEQVLRMLGLKGSDKSNSKK